MAVSTRKKWIRQALRASGALIVCGAVSWASVGIGVADSRTAKVSALRTCSKSKSKRMARKSRLRCPGNGGSGSTTTPPTTTSPTTTPPPPTTTTTSPPTTTTPPSTTTTPPPTTTTPPPPAAPDTVIDQLGPGTENQVYQDHHGVWQSQPGTFICQVDSQPEQACDTPVGSAYPNWYTIKYNGLAPGNHTFKVTAVENGVRDPSPAMQVLNIPAPPTTYTLSASVTGSGTVTGSGISCPGTCSVSLTSGTAVTLTESPASGSTFSGWGGACSGTGSTCTVTMSAAKSVTATFTSSSQTGGPPFLQGLSKLWFDDGSNPDPMPKWGEISMQRKDGVQSPSYNMNDIVASRFTQFSSGGPQNKPYYRYYAPQGDNIWTPGTAGRSELSEQPQWFYEGQRRVTMASIRLPSGWNVNAPGWRTILQWKQNEGKNWTGGSPAMALEQRSGQWIITSFGGPIVWQMPAQAGTWVNFAFDITFSANPSLGKLKVYADLDGDGNYEYSSSSVTLQTLLQQQSGSGPGIESHLRAGVYEGVGGDSIDETNYAIYG